MRHQLAPPVIAAMSWRAALGAGAVLAVGGAAPPDHAIALALIALATAVLCALIGGVAPLFRDTYRNRQKRTRERLLADIARLERELAEARR